MEVWAFKVLSFEIGVFNNYLMNIGENFLFVKSFDVVYILELIKEMVSICFGMNRKSWEAILQNFKIQKKKCVQ